MKTLGFLIAVAAVAMVALASGGECSDCYSRFNGGYSYNSGYSYYPSATYYVPLTYSVSRSGDRVDVNKLLDAFMAAKEGELKAEREKNDLLRSLLESGGALPPALKDALRPPHKGDLLTRNSCVKCHSDADKAGDGGGHVLYSAGKPVAGADFAKMRDRVLSTNPKKRMPPGSDWTAEQKLDWLDWHTRVPLAGEAKAPPKIEME